MTPCCDAILRTIVLPAVLATAAFCCLSARAEAGPGAAAEYWRPAETSPGAFLCPRPAATDVVVSCDRWPDATDLRRFAEDAVRLSGAKSDQEKALAVWRWIRRLKVHTDGNPPTNKLCGEGRIDDVVQVLNVYGAHYCGGLSRVACQVWRAYGRRADRVSSASHSMVELYYTDADRVTRPHLFDVNFGGYLYDHSRTRIASCTDWDIDYNGSKTNWVHDEHEPWSGHRMELSLRPGELLERIWGNWGKPYQQHMDPDRDARRTPLSERGPYRERTYGNGRWTYSPRLDSADWRTGLAEPPVNVADGGLMPAEAGRPASAVWHFRTPYVVSDAEVRMTLLRGAADTIRLLLSVDDGKSWDAVWQCPADVTAGEAVAAICPRFDVTEAAAVPKDFHSPFGRYAYRLKLDLTAAGRPADCRVERIAFDTTVQQNFYALPQLQPGRNRITVRGRLAEGAALKVAYVWDDPLGKGRRNETLVERAPFTYEILAAGTKWEDCVCRSLTVEAVAATGQGNRTLVKEQPSEVHALAPMSPVDSTRGRGGWWQRDRIDKLPPVDRLIADLAVEAKRESAIKALQELRDPKAFDAVVKFACAEREPLLKDTALVALFGTDRAKAKPILLDLLEHPERAAWTDEAVKKGPADGNQHWAYTAVLIGEMAAEAGWPEAIPGLVKVWKSGYMKKHVPFAIMRVFSRLADARAADAVREGLQQKSYTAAYAALAAARLGLKDAIPDVRKVAAGHYRVWQEYAILALGRLGDRDSAPAIRAQLASWDENLRAAAAEALAAMGDRDSADALRAAAAAEPFDWVRGVMNESLAKLK